MATTLKKPTLPTYNSLSAGSYINSLGTELLLDSNGNPLLLPDAPGKERASFSEVPEDSTWIRQSFMVAMPDKASGKLIGSLLDQDKANSSFSTAALKYMDSSIGGNTVINPPPQFTRYADIRFPGIAADSKEVSIEMQNSYNHQGMGRYYSEAIDDNNQVIHLRFGVASYNSLTQFFTGFYNGNMASAARAGRFTDGIIKKFASAAGTIIGLAVAPLFLIPIAVLLLGTAARYFANYPSSKFYSLKPVMPVYWNTVTSIVNQMAVNSGLSSYFDTSQSKKLFAAAGGDTNMTRSAGMNMVGRFLPEGIIDESGTINVYAMANRASRLAIVRDKMISDAFEAAGPNDSWFDVIRKLNDGNKKPIAISAPAKSNSIIDYLSSAWNSVFHKTADKNSTVETDFKLPPTPAAGTPEAGTPEAKGAAPAEKGATAAGASPSATPAADSSNIYKSSVVDSVFKYIESNWDDGSEFVSYRVDYTGPVSESFSNSVAPSSLASKINSMSSSNRDMRINLADGNGVPGMDSIVSAVTGFANSFASVLHIEGIAAFAGSAFVDIPQHWDTSSAKLPQATYTMTLIAPYGNPVSQLFSIWVPLATLLAGALPLATGAQSHTSPFLCELHDRGRCMTRLGMIDSLTITRGTSNLGFNNDCNALAVDVSFTVLDLSSIIAVAVEPEVNISSLVDSLFSVDNSFTDYLMAISALKLGDTIYRIPMLKYSANKTVANLSTFFSAAHFASYFASLPGINQIAAVYRGTDRK